MPSVIDLKLSKAFPAPRAYDPANTFFDLTEEAESQTRIANPEKWVVARVHLRERLGELYRCEVVITRREQPPQRAPSQLDGSDLFSRTQDALDRLKQGNNAIDSAENAYDSASDPLSKAGAALGVAQAYANYAGQAFGEGVGMVNDAMNSFANWNSVQTEILGIEPDQPPWIPEAPPDPAEFMGTFRTVRVARTQTRDGQLYHARWISGIVREFEDHGILPSGRRVVRLVISPQLWKLSLRKNHRLFHRLDPLAILEQLFKEANVYATGFDRSLVPALKTRDHCVQYGESDLELAMRLCREEGLVPCFDQQLGCEQLRLMPFDAIHTGSFVHALAAEVPLPQINSAASGSGFDGETVWDFRVRTALRTTGVAQRAHDFSRPYEPTAGEYLSSGEVENRVITTAGELTVHEYPARIEPTFDAASGKQTPQTDLAHESQLKLAELRADARIGTGGTDSISMATGQIAVIVHTLGTPAFAHHTSTAPFGNFLVTEYDSLAESVALAFGTSDPPTRMPPRPMGGFQPYGQRDFEAIFRVVPQNVPYFPSVGKAKPAIDGVQTAVVLAGETAPDKNGDVIEVDPIGRVRVKMHWDRFVPPGGTRPMSYPIRVAERWAGAGWGTTFLPREGMELVLAFLEGDPDRAVGLGMVYNRVSPSPRERAHLDVVGKENHVTKENDVGAKKRLHYRKDAAIKADGNAAISLIRTRAHPVEGDRPERAEGYHELSFDDTPKKERVRIHSEGDLTETVLRDHKSTVHQDETNVVQGNQREKIGETQTLTVEGTRRKVVDGNELETVHGKRREVVKGQRQLEVKGDRREKVHKDESITVGMPGDMCFRNLTVHGDRNTVIEGDETRTVTGKVDEIIGGAFSIGGAPLTMKSTAGTPGKGAGLGVDGEGNLEVTAPEGKIEVHAKGEGEQGKVEMRTKRTKISGKTKVRFECGDVSLELAPGEIKIDAPGGLELQCGLSKVVLLAEQGSLDLSAGYTAIPGEGPNGHFFMRLKPGEAAVPVPQEELFNGPGVLINTDRFLVKCGMYQVKGKKILVQSGDEEIIKQRNLTDAEQKLVDDIKRLRTEIEDLRVEVKKLEGERDKARNDYLTAAADRAKVEEEIKSSGGADDDLKEAIDELNAAERELEEANRDVAMAEDALKAAKARGEDTDDEEEALDDAKDRQEDAKERLEDAEEELDDQKEDHGEQIKKLEDARAKEEQKENELNAAQDRLAAKQQELEKKRAELAKKEDAAAKQEIPTEEPAQDPPAQDPASQQATAP